MTDNVSIAIISGAASIIGIGLTALVNYKLGKLHKQINSRMDQLLQLNKDKSKAEGKLEEASEEKNRQEKLKP